MQHNYKYEYSLLIFSRKVDWEGAGESSGALGVFYILNCVVSLCVWGGCVCTHTCVHVGHSSLNITFKISVL